jgi:hypothetical protein
MFIFHFFSVLLRELFHGITIYIPMFLLKIRKTSEYKNYSMFYSIYVESTYFVSTHLVLSLLLSLFIIFHLTLLIVDCLFQ